MSIHLVTGYAGKEHITSADQGSFNAGIIGKNKYILSTGNQFAAEIVSNNLVKIKDGDLVNQGRHIRIEANDYEECTIENGTQSQYRNDLIVARYSKNADTGIESMDVVVIKGTASASSSPADPTYTSGDILNGALTDDFPLYRVRLNGLSITAVEPLFGDPVKSLSELNTDMGTFQICYRKFEEVSQASVATDTEATKTISWTMDDEEVEKFTTNNQGERQIWLVPVGLAYCTILGFPTFSISGTTVTMSIRLYNATTITHTLTARVMILAVRKISD